jgi:hypothetical protein
MCRRRRQQPRDPNDIFTSTFPYHCVTGSAALRIDRPCFFLPSSIVSAHPASSFLCCLLPPLLWLLRPRVQIDTEPASRSWPSLLCSRCRCWLPPQLLLLSAVQVPAALQQAAALPPPRMPRPSVGLVSGGGGPPCSPQLSRRAGSGNAGMRGRRMPTQ